MSDYKTDLYKAAALTEREKRYLRHLTREASTPDALAMFVKYVGWIDSEGYKPKQRPLQARIDRLKQLAAMPNLWNTLK